MARKAARGNLATATLLDKVGTLFGFAHERIPGKGEDSCCWRLHEQGGVMAVFDGCGGSGAESYERLGGHTGAWLASRAASTATLQWFERQSSLLARGRRMPLDIAALQGEIFRTLSLCEHHSGQPRTKIRGSIVKTMPTTMAAFVLRRQGSDTVLSTIYAGDSRLYVLDPEGLKQASVDDVSGGDAFINLYGDPPMTNVISLDEPFELNVSEFALRGECVLLAATDGCFGYLGSPMEFELLLLSALDESQSIDEWQERLECAIGEVAGDDFTMLALVYGYDGFVQLKESLADRLATLSCLMDGISASAGAHEERSRIWEGYRSDYYALSAEGTRCDG